MENQTHTDKTTQVRIWSLHFSYSIEFWQFSILNFRLCSFRRLSFSINVEISKQTVAHHSNHLLIELFSFSFVIVGVCIRIITIPHNFALSFFCLFWLGTPCVMLSAWVEIEWRKNWEYTKNTHTHNVHTHAYAYDWTHIHTYMHSCTPNTHTHMAVVVSFCLFVCCEVSWFPKIKCDPIAFKVVRHLYDSVWISSINNHSIISFMFRKKIDKIIKNRKKYLKNHNFFFGFSPNCLWLYFRWIAFEFEIGAAAFGFTLKPMSIFRL